MIKGTIRLGDSVIHLYDVHEVGTSDQKMWNGYIEHGRTDRSYTFFSDEGWQFTPERKSLAEQINELAVGTLFYINPEGMRYIKVDEDTVVRLMKGENGLVARTFMASRLAAGNDTGYEFLTVLDWSEIQ